MRRKRTYEFKEGSRLKAGKADLVGRELEKLERGHGGVSAERVVGAAEAKSHPLHEFFDWTDKSAAHQYRLTQARHLIRCVVVVYDDVPKMTAPIRAYLTMGPPDADAVGDGDDKRYVSTHTIMSDAELREQLLAQAMQEFQSWENRYLHLKALKGVFVEAAKVETRRKQREATKDRVAEKDDSCSSSGLAVLARLKKDRERREATRKKAKATEKALKRSQRKRG